MNEKILHDLSSREMSINELKKDAEAEKILRSLHEMEDDGLIFVNNNEKYALTLLGKIVALDKHDVYEEIAEREDLFEFFRTRIPSVMPDKLLTKFCVADDFSLIGKPDMVERQKELTSKALSIQPYATEEMCVSTPSLFKPGTFHMLGTFLKRTRTRAIISKKAYEENSNFLKVAEKVTKFKVKVIKDIYHYMGMVCTNEPHCIFGFHNVKEVPGWDALIHTENKESISWVQENFEYMWNTLARKPKD